MEIGMKVSQKTRNKLRSLLQCTTPGYRPKRRFTSKVFICADAKSCSLSFDPKYLGNSLSTDQ